MIAPRVAANIIKDIFNFKLKAEKPKKRKNKVPGVKVPNPGIDSIKADRNTNIGKYMDTNSECILK